MRISPVLLAMSILVLVAAPIASATALTITIHAGTNADKSMYFKDAAGSKAVMVNLNDAVTIHVLNDDITADKNVTTPHDLAILGLGQATDPAAEAGECPQAQEESGPKVAFEVCKDDEVQKTFTADKAGTFTFKCEVPGHAGLGMAGTFTVASAATVAKTPAAPMALVLVAIGAIALVVTRRRG